MEDFGMIMIKFCRSNFEPIKKRNFRGKKVKFCGLKLQTTKKIKFIRRKNMRIKKIKFCGQNFLTTKIDNNFTNKKRLI